MENSFQVLVIIGRRETCLKGTVSLSHVRHLHVFCQWHCVGVLNTRQRNLRAWCRCRVFPILHKKNKKSLLTFLLQTQNWVFLPSHCLSPFLTSGKDREKEKYFILFKKTWKTRKHKNKCNDCINFFFIRVPYWWKITQGPQSFSPFFFLKHYASFFTFYFFNNARIVVMVIRCSKLTCFSFTHGVK